MSRRLTTEDLVLNIIVNSNKAQSEIGKVSRELQDAKSKLTQAEAEMKRLERAGQTSSQQYQRLRADVQNYNAVITDSRRRLSELNQSISLQDKSLQQLQTSLNRTRQLWRQATNDADRARYAEEMQLLNNRIAELSQGAEHTGNTLIRMSNRLNQYIGSIVAGGASLIASWRGASKAINEYAAFDDLLSDVMKTTNLNKEAVKELNEELAKLQTRTSQEDLLGLSRIAGKLGYTEIEDITEFVRANNQIIVALNEDLGGNVEETVNKIGKLVDIFKLKDLYTTEEAFLKVGSAINELGMASTANEGYMVEFARRMAGVAPLAKISIDQIFGLGAALDQLGQSEEVASTALSKLFLKLASEAETYAKYAGMSLKDFQKLLEEDFMAAFTRVLQGVKNNSEGINQLAATLGDLGEDGGRVVGVIGSLANNVDILTSSMDLANKSMKDGTSITNEYNIKNENAAAKLEMAQKEVKRLWVELGEKLWPVMTTGLNIFSIFIGVLSKTISFVSNNIRVISSLVITLTAYYTVVQIAAKWEAITTALMATKRVAVLSLNLVYALLTGNLTRAAAAQQLLNLRMMANPYGLVAAAIVGLTALVVTYAGKLSAVEKAQKAINDTNNEALQSTAAQRAEIQRLTKTITDETASRSLRLTAINRLREIMPDVLKNYSDEALMAGKATEAIENQTAALLFQAKIKAKQKQLDSLVEESERYNQPDSGGFWRSVSNVVFGEANTDYFRGRSRQQYEDRISAINIATQDLQKTQSEYLKFRDANKTKLDNIVDSEVKKVDIADGSAKRKAFQKELDEAEKHYQALLQKEGLFREDLSELTKEELEKLAQLEANHQAKIDAIHKKYGENLKTISQTAEKELKRRADAEKKYIDSILIAKQSEADAEKSAFEDRLKKAGLFGVDREKLTERQLKALEILESQHKANLAKIDSDAIAKEIDSRINNNRDAITDLRIRHAEEIAEIKTLAQAKEVLSATLSDRELAQVRSLGQARKLILNQQQLEEQALLREQLNSLLETLRRAQDSGQFDGINLADSILSDEEKKVLEDRIRQIREELAKLTGLDKSDELIEDDSRKKRDVLGMSIEDWDKLFENVGTTQEKLERMYGALEALGQIWSQYNQMVAAKENAQLQKDEAANNKKKENLQKRLESGAISQEQYNKQIEKLDKDLDKKKAVVARNQAKREKNVSFMSAIVNTARGITEAFPNPFLIALITALGALQIGTIASTPLPEIPGAQSGGQFLEVTRAQDGKRFKAKSDPSKRGYVDNPTVLVGENGREWVANADAVANPTVKPILDVLDVAQKNGSISTLNLSELIGSTLGAGRIPGRRTGGSFVESSAASTQIVPMSDPMLIKTLEKLDNRLSNLTARVTLLGKDGFIEQMDEYQKIKSNSSF